MADQFDALRSMKYSGRGITIGRTPSGILFVGYTLTGRSPPSQARKLIHDKESGVVRTEVTDQRQLEEGSPALLIYPAMAAVRDNSRRFGRIVVSNGAQTKLLYSYGMESPSSNPEDIIKNALEKPHFEYDKKDKKWIDITTFEPDAPNFTPRINAALDLINGQAAFSIISKHFDDPTSDLDYSEQHTVYPERGQSFSITTYAGGNEKPLRSFVRGVGPLEGRVDSDRAQDLVNSLYSAVRGGEKADDDFRVAAAVMMLKESGLTKTELEVAVLNRDEIQ